MSKKRVFPELFFPSFLQLWWRNKWSWVKKYRWLWSLCYNI